MQQPVKPGLGASGLGIHQDNIHAQPSIAAKAPRKLPRGPAEAAHTRIARLEELVGNDCDLQSCAIALVEG